MGDGRTSSRIAGLTVEVVQLIVERLQRPIGDSVHVPASPARPSRRPFLRWRFSCGGQSDRSPVCELGGTISWYFVCVVRSLSQSIVVFWYVVEYHSIILFTCARWTTKEKHVSYKYGVLQEWAEARGPKQNAREFFCTSSQCMSISVRLCTQHTTHRSGTMMPQNSPLASIGCGIADLL